MLHSFPLCLGNVPYSTVIEVGGCIIRSGIDVVQVLILHLGQAPHPLPLLLHVRVQELEVIVLGVQWPCLLLEFFE